MGLYQECVEAYDMVLGDGSLIRATRDNEYSDLYHCLPWSHGTLGKIKSNFCHPIRKRYQNTLSFFIYPLMRLNNIFGTKIKIISKALLELR